MLSVNKPAFPSGSASVQALRAKVDKHPQTSKTKNNTKLRWLNKRESLEAASLTQEDLLSPGFSLSELKGFLTFIAEYRKKGFVKCEAHKHNDHVLSLDGGVKKDGNYHPRMICKVRDGDERLSHSFNPLTLWYQLPVVVPGHLHKVLNYVQELFPPPPDCPILCSPILTDEPQEEEFQDVLDETNENIPLSPSGKTYKQEALECFSPMALNKTKHLEEIPKNSRGWIQVKSSPRLGSKRPPSPNTSTSNPFEILSDKKQARRGMEEKLRLMDRDIEELSRSLASTKPTTPVRPRARKPSPLKDLTNEECIILSSSLPELPQLESNQTKTVDDLSILVKKPPSFSDVAKKLLNNDFGVKKRFSTIKESRPKNKEEALLVFAGKDLSQINKVKTKLELVYVIGMKKNNRALIRDSLRLWNIDTRKIIDISFVGREITSLLIPKAEAPKIIDLIETIPGKTVLINFDPLDIKHMSTLHKYKNMNESQLREEAKRLAIKRFESQAERLPESREGTKRFLLMQAHKLRFPDTQETARPITPTTSTCPDVVSSNQELQC